MNKELEQLRHHCEALEARILALQTVVLAITPAYQHDPRFAAAIKAAHESTMTHHLNSPRSTDVFISHYFEMLRALTPKHLHENIQ